MAVDVSKLRDAVAHETTVNDSAIALLKGVPQMIRDAIAADDIADAANINALADTIETNATSLASAVSENTPAAPPAPPAPSTPPA